jgi:hypothetical protein
MLRCLLRVSGLACVILNRLTFFVTFVAYIIFKWGQPALITFFILYLLLLFPILGCYLFLVNKETVDSRVGDDYYNINLH